MKINVAEASEFLWIEGDVGTLRARNITLTLRFVLAVSPLLQNCALYGAFICLRYVGLTDTTVRFTMNFPQMTAIHVTMEIFVEDLDCSDILSRVTSAPPRYVFSEGCSRCEE